MWRHTSWRFLGDNAPFSSNGVVIAGERRVLVADTPWNADEAEPLIERVRAVAPGREIVLVVTHAHDDRMIGMPAFQAAGAETWAHVLTQADAASRGLTRAAHTWLARLKRFDLGGRVVEAFHPGAAHTRDNCVVWDETTGTLDGGCMVRPLAMGLGNTADGDLAAYPVSVARLNARYLARARIVVPGHGETGGV
ncbi:MAG: MBL fold metallo-hydrolase, partial [Hyphomonadaceae bacterium]